MSEAEHAARADAYAMSHERGATASDLNGIPDGDRLVIEQALEDAIELMDDKTDENVWGDDYSDEDRRAMRHRLNRYRDLGRRLEEIS